MRSTALHVEQLVVDAEARLLGVVVDAVDASQEAGSPCARRRSSVARHGAGATAQRRLVAEVARVEDGVRVGLAQVLSDQLEAGRVRHSVPFPPPDTSIACCAAASSAIADSTTSSVPRPP